MLPEETHPRSVPVGVQRSLRKTEIDIGSFAAIDELCRQNMEAFIPHEAHGQGVRQQAQTEESGNPVDPKAGLG